MKIAKKVRVTSEQQAIKNAATLAALEAIRADKDNLTLTIGTGNSKAGTTFGLENIRTCPGATALCKALCYVSEGAMNFSLARLMRARNTQACHNALRIGGPELLAALLIAAIDRANIAVLRFHDSGDFFSCAYIQAWILVAKQRPNLTLFGYTRSWRVPALKEELAAFAALKNVKLWLSADQDCFLPCLTEIKSNKVWRGLAFMQSVGTEETAVFLDSALPKGRFINFPAHSKTKAKQSPITPGIRNCPAVTGQIKESRSNPACLQCRICFK